MSINTIVALAAREAMNDLESIQNEMQGLRNLLDNEDFVLPERASRAIREVTAFVFSSSESMGEWVIAIREAGK